ncbi:MAG: transposase [Gammaproteobacteria bacterium]|nr:transposase [Gammaproteobacteria bacterium]
MESAWIRKDNGLARGYEALNDHQHLRRAVALRTAVERDALHRASSATLCCLAQRADRATALSIYAVLVNQFISAFKRY